MIDALAVIGAANLNLLFIDLNFLIDGDHWKVEQKIHAAVITNINFNHAVYDDSFKWRT